ncbi:hypothetical protein [Lusitaniella coriacea]|uniref:hypothetical protein n=1 Tax=Lusitaniella coriacea TaxID=1983105 RepID=UPI003CE6F940
MIDNSSKKNSPFGIWDLNLSPITIGGLLTLLGELKVLGEQHQATEVELGISWIPDNSSPLSNLLGKNSQISFTKSSACSEVPLLVMLLDMEGVAACHLFRTGTDLQEFLSQTTKCYITWPPLNSEGKVDYKYNYTHLIQKFFNERGYIPTLSSKTASRQWAMDLVRDRVLPSSPIVVHLKNYIRASGQPDWYNAQMEEWQAFFQMARSRYDVKFLLIGNEAIPQNIQTLPNVIVTQDLGSNLLKDLALIPLSYAFMGVASGPSNMAIFNRVPYLIYKNPEHHVEMMRKELGTSDKFVFATPYQRFYRRFETSDDILKEFDRIWQNNFTSDWKTRFET